MAAVIPFDPDQREYWRHDPAAFDAIERMFDAFELLADALYEQANTIGIGFSMMYEPHRIAGLEKNPDLARDEPERLRRAHELAETAHAQWAAAVKDADELLRRRQEGGE